MSGGICTLRRALLTAAMVLVAFAPSALANEPLPALPVIHPAIAVSHPEIVQKFATFKTERDVIRARHKKFRAACASVDEGSAADRWCATEEAALQDEIGDHYLASLALIKTYLGLLSQFTIEAQIAYARTQRWSDKELNSLKAGFKAFASADDADYDPGKVNAIWKAMAARNGDADLTRLAAAAKGFSATGAGTQGNKEDCAVFAVANAAGVPYGAVAAMATKFVGEGKWRRAEERDDPQKTIEEVGLNGGEVLLLAEYYGMARVLARDEFDAALNASDPVMINIYPADNSLLRGHQVVLTKTFKDGSVRWYEAMDSNRGPIAKMFIRADELTALLKEPGIAYAPDRRAIRPLQ